MSDTTTSNPARSVQRVRHTLKLRPAEVRAVRRLSPNVARIRFGGAALHDFISASFDDHVKLMLPARPGEALVLPTIGPDGPSFPPGAPKPVMRDYTPRSFNAAAGELDIEFALHGDGPAARWAAQAAPGQTVGIGGPRGSFIVPDDYDWHWLIGDEAALPAIARRLEELPAGVAVTAIVEVHDAADQRKLETRADLTLQWVQAPAPGTEPNDAALVQAVRELRLPAGEGYAWAAGEAAAIAAVRRVLVNAHGLDKNHIRAAAYWKHGNAGHHENLES